MLFHYLRTTEYQASYGVLLSYSCSDANLQNKLLTCKPTLLRLVITKFGWISTIGGWPYAWNTCHRCDGPVAPVQMACTDENKCLLLWRPFTIMISGTPITTAAFVRYADKLQRRLGKSPRLGHRSQAGQYSSKRNKVYFIHSGDNSNKLVHRQFGYICS